jgi:hypothetical protein
MPSDHNAMPVITSYSASPFSPLSGISNAHNITLSLTFPELRHSSAFIKTHKVLSPAGNTRPPASTGYYNSFILISAKTTFEAPNLVKKPSVYWRRNGQIDLLRWQALQPCGLSQSELNANYQSPKYRRTSDDW